MPARSGSAFNSATEPIVSLDALLRMSSNPFFPYMIARIEEGIPASAAETSIKAATPPP